ncbi:MAG: cation transporter, partial [Phycisphaerales bacterium JB039]
MSATLRIDGMHCASCVARVEDALKKAPGVRSASVNLTEGRAVVEGDGLDIDSLTSAVRATGFDAEPEQAGASLAEQRSELEERQRRSETAWRRRFLAGLACWAPIAVIHWLGPALGLSHVDSPAGPWLWIIAALATVAQVYVGKGFYQSALKAARHKSTNMDTLIAMGSTAAYLFS